MVQEYHLIMIQEYHLIMAQEYHLIMVQEYHLSMVQEYHLIMVQEYHLTMVQEYHLLFLQFPLLEKNHHSKLYLKIIYQYNSIVYINVLCDPCSTIRRIARTKVRWAQPDMQ